MVPPKERVSDNLGPISEVLVMGLEVSFSGDFVSWSLRFWNQGLAVLQSPKFTILYP